MKQFEENKEVREAEDRYTEEWFAKFGRSPVFGTLDFEALRWVIQQIEKDECLDAIRHYFTMKEDWFIKKAYSVGVFKDNLNLVLADMGAVESRARVSVKNRASALEVDAEILQLSKEESRKRLNLDPDGVDDWMLSEEKLSDDHFKQWKTLSKWSVEIAKKRIKGAAKNLGNKLPSERNDRQPLTHSINKGEVW